MAAAWALWRELMPSPLTASCACEGQRCDFYLLGRLDGRGHADVLAQLRTNLVPAVKRNYQVWPLVQLVNFLYVPPRLSVAFIQTIAIVMNALLTWRARRL
eukprot:TRINITY_DN18706_c0_g1_i2.p2 TRINITY_DN18706_c0_g1~~TRINITY_DN18706_c0_g1_i2.p2  ORF type:complete len:101 (+),score=13.51 TRINITY_DN18706_c0_g1_i2:55-357(+)